MTIPRLIGNPLPKIGSRCHAGRRKKYDALFALCLKIGPLFDGFFLMKTL